MKKILLSTFTIAGFALYVIFFGKNETLTYVDTTTSTPIEKTPTPTPDGKYKDGNYTGYSADAYYGFIQVKAVIKSGKLADVVFLKYPNDRRTSIQISNYAMPILKTEAITSQNAQVDIVSGATDSSEAFRKSLADALAQAKI